MTAIQFLHIGNDQLSSCFHCDIKAANIMLKRDFTAQLIDCGMAKFMFDRNESRSKRATGYLWSGYGSGGMRLECSSDILSFGVILLELLTGKLHNDKDEDGSLEERYAQDQNGMARDIKMDIDPAMGYGTLTLPKYVQEFADLAICCMQSELKNRPAGEAVMAKLVAILSQCCSRDCDDSSGFFLEIQCLAILTFNPRTTVRSAEPFLSWRHIVSAQSASPLKNGERKCRFGERRAEFFCQPQQCSMPRSLSSAA